MKCSDIFRKSERERVNVIILLMVVPVVKNPPANAGDAVSNPGLGRTPREGNGNPTPVFLPGKSHGQRSLAGYSLWGCKESEMTE